MTRNLKALGLALVAVLALSAVAASSASAIGKFTSPAGYPQTLVTEDSGVADSFTLAGSTLVCSEETFDGTLSEATSHITIYPTYKGCKTSGATFNNVTVTDNGCAFTFTVNTTITTDHDSGNVHIDCPPNQVIELHHYSTHNNHTAGISSCTVTIGAQTVTHKATYTSQTPTNNILIEGNLTAHSLIHGSCSFGLTVNSTGQYHLSTTASASSGARVHVG